MSDRSARSTTHAASVAAVRGDLRHGRDFYDRFDYGFSGSIPRAATTVSSRVHTFHGDHDADVRGADDRPDGALHRRAISQLFWHCAPGGDGTKGHLMTGVDTIGYNIAWFSPKPMFEKVTQVCWDINADSDVQPQVDHRSCSWTARRRRDSLPGRRELTAAAGSRLRWLRPRLHVARLPQRRARTTGSCPTAARSPG